MRRIYHLLSRATWEQCPAASYSAESLATEGFIHCSNADQLARTANLFYPDVADLLVLAIDVERLTSPVKDEAVGAERFPHVLGPINREAIVEVCPLRRGPEGNWLFAP